MSTLQSFARKAARPVLTVTAISTAPAFLFFILSIIAWLFPHTTQPGNDPQEFDPASMIVAMLCFVFFSALGSFAIAAAVALMWHLLEQAWKKRELRRIGKRFGWPPQP
jgi:Ca2+/Na+ antiporter